MFIYIDTPQYAVFAFHFMYKGSLFLIMYQVFFFLVYRDVDM